ncbi:intermembrane lipid transfer protein VPS13B-like [Oncorhynchus masou masou]|uniref:intermembrane lipid transfer protein VPS13B-like n=1 Tax=Oncorhynchus masou masou TaxID=90313 RepID=UPI0031842489
MMFSCLPTTDPGPVAGSESWSLPAPIRPDFPRQSVAVPGEICSSSGLSTRALVMTCQEHLGVTYVTLNEDPCPHMVIHNQTPLSMLLRENVKEPPRTEVYCRPLPANSSLHHGLYHHFSSFPACRQREPLPTVRLKTSPDPNSLPPGDLQASPEWSDPVDINCPGTQVVFLPGFGCLYIDVVHQDGTIILTLAPEGSVDSVMSLHNRTSNRKLAFRVLLSEASVSLSDDITSRSGSVELLRLTLSKLLLNLCPARLGDSGMGLVTAGMGEACLVEVHCASLQVGRLVFIGHLTKAVYRSPDEGCL